MISSARRGQGRIRGRSALAAAAVLALSGGATAAPITVAPTTWVPFGEPLDPAVTTTTVGVSTSAVAGGNALVVVWVNHGTIVSDSYAVVVQRQGRRSRVIARTKLPVQLESVTAAASDHAGRWLVTGRSLSPAAPAGVSTVARLTPHGALDMTFGTNGLVPVDGDAVDIVSDRDSHPLILVNRPAPPSNPHSTLTSAVLRLTTAGAPDPAFGVGGAAVTGPDEATATSAMGVPASGYTQTARSLALTGKSAVLVSGELDRATTQLGYLTRLTPAGVIDPGFGTGAGTVVYGPFRTGVPRGRYGDGLSVEPRYGNIYLSGMPSKDANAVTWKRTAAGLRNGSFGFHGWFRSPTAGPVVTNAATCDGGVVVVTRQHIRVLTRTGRYDARFGVKGTITVAPASPLAKITTAAGDLRFSCPRNLVIASERAQGLRPGFTVTWLSLPGPVVPVLKV